MRTRKVLVALATALATMTATAGDAYALAHIEGGGVFTDGEGEFSPGLTADYVGPQTTTLHFTGVGAAYHFIIADVVTWDCTFTVTNHIADVPTDPPTPVDAVETLAAGVGTAVGGCQGTPKLIGTGTVDIICPLIGPMAYARVGAAVELAGVCLATWQGIADIADVTITLVVKPKVPAWPADPVTGFYVEAGGFRYRG